MRTIKKADFIDSIADSLQFISYYHPVDFVKAMLKTTSDISRRLGAESADDAVSATHTPMPRAKPPGKASA